MNAKFLDNPLLGPQSRADFIVANLPLVYSVANRYKTACKAANIPLEDAESEGKIGLILAYDRYSDPSVAFGTFAFAQIRGCIQKLFRKSVGHLLIPERMYPLVQAITQRGLNEASAEVIAAELGISVKKAERVLYCDRIRVSYELPEIDNNGASDDTSDIFTEEFIAELRPKQQRIVHLMMTGLAQFEAAEVLGVTRKAVNNHVKLIRESYEVYEKISA